MEVVFTPPRPSPSEGWWGDSPGTHNHGGHGLPLIREDGRLPPPVLNLPPASMPHLLWSPVEFKCFFSSGSCYCVMCIQSQRERESFCERLSLDTPRAFGSGPPLFAHSPSPSLPAAPSLAVFPNQPPSCPSTWTPGAVEEEGGKFGCYTDREVLLAPRGLWSGTVTIL